MSIARTRRPDAIHAAQQQGVDALTTVRVPRDHRVTSATGQVRIALMPFLCEGEVEWAVRTDDKGEPRYGVAPRSARLHDRVPAALERLDDSGGHIAVLPEAAADPVLLAAWQEAMRARPPGSTSQLRWVLVGTGPAGGSWPSPNRAWLVDRASAEVIAVQDKRSPFCVEQRLAQRWGIDSVLPGLPCQEDIDASDTLRVIDAGQVRLAILVCEDLASVLRTAPHIADAKLTHVLVPVISDSVDAGRWQHKEAEEAFAGTDTTVVVSNSLALSHVPARDGRFYTGLAWRAGEPLVQVAADGPLDVHVIETSASGVRTVTPG